MEGDRLTEEQEARIATRLEAHLKSRNFINIKITSSSKDKNALDIVCTGTGRGNMPIAHKGTAVLNGDSIVMSLKPCWGLSSEDHDRYAGMLKDIAKAIDKANEQEGQQGAQQGDDNHVEEH